MNENEKESGFSGLRGIDDETSHLSNKSWEMASPFPEKHSLERFPKITPRDDYVPGFPPASTFKKTGCFFT